MKDYWNNQGSIVLAFSISLLLCFAFQFSSLILLSKQITATSEDYLKQFKGIKAGCDMQNDKITLLELQNKNQDDRIQFLQTKISEHDNHNIYPKNKNGPNNINSLKRGSFYPSSEKENGAADDDDRHVIRQEEKRPARLLPLQLIASDEDHEIYTRPPSSCNDLNALGHTLNGIYLIKKNKNSISKIIDAVFCDFKPQTRSSIIAIENRLGHLNVNASSSGIYFYVQRHGSLPTPSNGVIRFNKERLNMGGAMNISTGVFTVPKAGIYQFSVTIAKEGYSLDAVWVYFRINGNKIGMSAVGATVTGAPATLHPILKLKKGDRVDLWKDNSFGTLEHLSDEISHHFSGGLLQEQDIV